jgi:cell wall-associated NlpC family hydrolase
MREMPAARGALWADLIGRPFAWGGRGPDAFDCFGLVREMLRRTGCELPAHDTPAERSAIASVVAAELALGRWVPAAPVADSVVLFRMPVVLAGERRRAITHCAFMVSDHEFIHAWAETGGVTVERLTDWQQRIAGFYTYAPAP